MKKSKKKINRLRLDKLVIFLLVFLAVIVVVLGCSVVKLIPKKVKFSIEPRAEMIKKAKDGDNEEYETVGWVRVQGTNIDLPLLYSKSYEPFVVEKDNYAWVIGKELDKENVVNIMGHNVFNLSSNPDINPELTKSFEPLMAFVYYDFAEDNKYIQLSIDDKDYVYKIYSVDFIYATDVSRFDYLDFNDKETTKNYLDMLKKNTIYDYDVDVNEDDKLLSLITCTRFFGNEGQKKDFLVNARLLREDEKIKDYNISKNDNYNKIEEILKGDEKNDEESV